MGPVAIASLVAAAGAIVVIPAAMSQWRSSKRQEHQLIVQSAVQDASEDQPQTARLALENTPQYWRPEAVPLLCEPGWLFAEPVPLDSVKIEWSKHDPALYDISEAKRHAGRLLPGSYASYSRTVIGEGHLDTLFNGAIYRPVKVSREGHELLLTFTTGRYFESLDTTEVLAHEAELTRKRNGRSPKHSYRAWLKDPFNLRQRVSSLGVLTLTLRKEETATGFYMQRRNPKAVLLGPGFAQVVPAGEFTPSNVGADAIRADFDIWRNIMREYAEEFLGRADAQGIGGETIDFESAEPFKTLAQGRQDGRLQVHAFGIGLDPLTWKAELLTVCVIDSELFDAALGQMMASGPEGTLITGSHKKGIPFDENHIQDYVKDENTRCAAVACLELAWRHRARLGVGQ